MLALSQRVPDGPAGDAKLRVHEDEGGAGVDDHSSLDLRFEPGARRVLDAQVALDLTAETFAQAYKGRRGFRGTTEPEARAWLLTIARRQIARFLERAATDRRLVERLGVQIPRLDAADVEELERRAGLPELRTIVGAELARLSEDQRVALRLRVVEERSYAQIAELLAIEEQTVRARVSRGLKALAVALDAHASAEGGTTCTNR